MGVIDLGGNCPGRVLSRGELVGGNCPGGIVRGGTDLEPSLGNHDFSQGNQSEKTPYIIMIV